LGVLGVLVYSSSVVWVALLCLNIPVTSDQFSCEVGWFDSIFKDLELVLWREKQGQSYREVYV